MSQSLWAELKGDQIAVHDPIGTRTFRQINEAANQIVRLLRERGLKEGDAVALLCSQPRASSSRCWRGLPARRLPADAGQLAPQRRRGRVHHQRLRCEGAVRRDPLSVGTRGQGAGADPEGLDRRRRARASSPTRSCWASSTAPTSLDPTPGSSHALHLRHHRPAEGRLPPQHRRDDGHGATGRAGRRAAVRRPGLPRRAAGLRRALLDGDGHPAGVPRPLGLRGRPEDDREIQGHPRPPGADHVPAAAQPARRGAQASTTSRRCATSSTARRPARPR